MNVISKITILNYIKEYPIAETALLAWHKAFLKSSYNNFNELKAVYTNASIINNRRVIFNIKGNTFRLIVSVDFKRQFAYIIWFGTHQEYDKIDAATVSYTEI
ncbi:MAG: type II toxin-antitoxin system HigB family toxin [Bacteroidota bacterium]